jgi:hypothetical protein
VHMPVALTIIDQHNHHLFQALLSGRLVWLL